MHPVLVQTRLGWRTSLKSMPGSAWTELPGSPRHSSQSALMCRPSLVRGVVGVVGAGGRWGCRGSWPAWIPGGVPPASMRAASSRRCADFPGCICSCVGLVLAKHLHLFFGVHASVVVCAAAYLTVSGFE